ncbi:MAG: NAD(P)/FAD-dependent oxidoreductase [Bacilli bacterium]|nr:NAD(P)/FAD-dependent oxidoreductase [Bacilli bacterium]
MIRIRQINMDVDHTEKDLKIKISKILRTNPNKIKKIKINKKSIDARKEIKIVYEVDIEIENENKFIKGDIKKTPDETYKYKITGTNKMKHRPVIVGAGPAGLFASYLLSKYNYKPIIIERGEDIKERVKTVNKFWKENILNPNSNVQFGLGGAGTFSDGKLNTSVKDKNNRQKFILKTFVKFGAPKKILYDSKPHIGTDLLREIIDNMKNEIIKYGGTFKFNTCLDDIIIENGKIDKIKINDEIIETDNLVLALGHSSRDTFRMLLNRGLEIKPKPFAIGIRIQHLQETINKSQYKRETNLPNASYKLTYKSSNGRGVYTFCMCPGGFVVNSSSEKEKLVINGMSNQKRNEKNANSAIIVTVSSKDFGLSPLDGMKFQEILEEKTYKIGNGKIPIQLYKDFKNNRKSNTIGKIKPTFKGSYTMANLNEIFPKYIKDSLIEAIDSFENKIKGFSDDEAIIAAIETRTSSPIKIIRDENFETNIKGIYPIGEGSGYSGGIMTSAIDGIKLAEQIAKKYNN